MLLMYVQLDIDINGTFIQHTKTRSYTNDLSSLVLHMQCTCPFLNKFIGCDNDSEQQIWLDSEIALSPPTLAINDLKSDEDNKVQYEY